MNSNGGLARPTLLTRNRDDLHIAPHLNDIKIS
jgi:hypothetical protein